MFGSFDAAAMSAMARASSSEEPNGFSQKTALPAAKAASAISRCVVGGEAITNASTRGFAIKSCQWPLELLKPNSIALHAAPSAVVLQIISQTGRNRVLNTAPTDCRATACAFPI